MSQVPNFHIGKILSTCSSNTLDVPPQLLEHNIFVIT